MEVRDKKGSKEWISETAGKVKETEREDKGW